MAKKDPQDFELAGRQVHRCTADADLVARRIELEWTDRDTASRIRLGARRVTKRDTQAGVELVDTERLRYVVVRAALEGDHLLALLISSGQDHGRRRGLAANPGDDRQTIEIRQAKVQQNDVRSAHGPAPQ